MFRKLTLCLIASFALLGFMALNANAARQGEEEPQGNEYKSKDGFVVHEWGVIQRLIQNGQWIARQHDADLPAFIKDVSAHFPKARDFGPMADKPIIYFYGPKGETFDVKIDCPHGSPKYVWPLCDLPAKAEGNNDRGGNPGIDENKVKKIEAVEIEIALDKAVNRARIGGRGDNGVALEWKNVSITGKQAKTDWEPADADHWFSKARDVYAPGIQVGDTKEKFLFYESNVDNYWPGAWPQVAQNGKVSMHNDGTWDIHDIFVVKVEDGKISLGYKDKLEGILTRRNKDKAKDRMEGKGDKKRAEMGESIDFELEVVEDKDPEAAVKAKLVARLEAAGLYAKEAQGMVDIWSKEFFQTNGTRVIYRMDQAEYDQIFPLTLSKKADKTVRVMLNCISVVK